MDESLDLGQKFLRMYILTHHPYYSACKFASRPEGFVLTNENFIEGRKQNSMLKKRTIDAQERREKRNRHPALQTCPCK